jgi:hypothetical protein
MDGQILASMYARCVRRFSHRLCACYGEARAWTVSSCSARLDGIPLGPYRVHGLALEDGLPVPGLRVTGTSEQSLGSCAAWACPHRDVSGPVSAPSGQILTQMWPSPDADVAMASFLLAPLQIARSLGGRACGRTVYSAPSRHRIPLEPLCLCSGSSPMPSTAASASGYAFFTQPERGRADAGTRWRWMTGGSCLARRVSGARTAWSRRCNSALS